MLPLETIFPQFEANQVLTNRHLNQLFRYLDEQNRLTRANLIGIGIVCGLDVVTASDSSYLTITRGCGITSEGYLVVQEELIARYTRPYTVPDELAYPPFSEGGPYEILELTASAEANTAPLSSAILADRVVVLFVELLRESLKNCSPNSCDDRGLEIRTTIRPLLIPRSLADQLQQPLGNGSDLNIGRMALPDIRMPRFDVLATGLTLTSDIVEAYRRLLSRNFLENTVRKALLDAYDVFQTLLNGLNRSELSNWQPVYGADGNILLDQPYAYQYAYDFVFDLLETYREIREKGIDTLSLCCPDSRLFPRHLFLKEAVPGVVHNRNYRHYFIPSPVFSQYRERAVDLRSLFSRLLAQVSSYELPNPASLTGFSDVFTHVPDAVLVRRPLVRITPSRLGDIFLSEKAIPYYYQVLAGAPPLYERWNAAKTREGKAKTNYSYHAEQYLDPVSQPADDPFWNPLRFDLERQNFYRIEGHVGTHYATALRQILKIRNTNRLAFDVVALRTGTVMDGAQLSTRYQGFFQDLEATARLMEACCANDEWRKRWQEEYERRIQQISEQLLLKNYVLRHPGIQHKAGVPVGGTFIVVYQGNEEELPAGDIRKGPFRIQGRVVDSDGSPLPGVTIQIVGATNSTNTNANGQFVLSVGVLPVQVRVSTVGFLTKNVWLNDTSATVTLYSEGEQPVGSKLPEGMVVADFYLPYQCCSDGPAVQLSITEPESKKLAVKVGKPECLEGNQLYQVPLSITGGTPPYLIDGQVVADPIFSPAIASGEPNEAKRTISVSDSMGAEETVLLPTHVCCDDPCGGEVSRARYIPWLAKPTEFVYGVTAHEAHLTVVDGAGQVLVDLDIKRIFEAVIGNNRIERGQYDDFMLKLCNEISELVKRRSPGAFQIEFSPQEQVLVIEHPACYAFKLYLQVTVIDRFERKHGWEYIYTEKQVVVDNVETQDSPISIPRFGLQSRNTCSGASDDKNCRVQIKGVEVRRDHDQVLLTPVFSPSIDLGAADFYWIAFGTTTSFSTKVQPSYTVSSVQLRAFAQVLVIQHEKGCWDYFSDMI